MNKIQLFDLSADPAETRDLAGDHSGEVARLTRLLEGWQKKLGDSQRLTSPSPKPLEFDFSKVKPAGQ